MYLGEFGAFEKAPMESRATWTAAIARGAEGLGISWCYWEFGSGFGAYDIQTDKWRKPILEALIPFEVKGDVVPRLRTRERIEPR